MSLFSFFRRSDKVAAQAAQPAEPAVNSALFIAAEAPAAAEEENIRSTVRAFLNKDFVQKGYDDGYAYPNADLMEASIKKLRSDFRLAVDLVIDEKRSDINELKRHMTNIRGISERLEQEMDQKIEEIVNLIHELDTQKLLSVENEGWIAGSVNDYRLGFIKGVQQYRQEKLLAGSTRLF